MTIMKSSATLLIVAAVSLSGCGTTEKDWKKAISANTAAAYSDFLAKHPKGAHVDEARTAIDEIDWNSIEEKNSIDYQKYIEAHPTGKHTVEAKAAIEAIMKDETDWTSAKEKNRIVAYEQYLANHSTGKHADEAKAAIETIEAKLPCLRAIQYPGTDMFCVEYAPEK